MKPRIRRKRCRTDLEERKFRQEVKSFIIAAWTDGTSRKFLKSSQVAREKGPSTLDLKRNTIP